MDYQFITTIATIVLVGTGIAGVILSAVRAVSRSMDARFATIDGRFVVANERFTAIDKRFENIDGRFDKIDERFDKVDQRFEKIDERFEKIDERFEKIDMRFEKIDQRFEKVDERFDKIDQRFIRIDERFFEMQKEFTALHAGMARLEGLVEGIRGTMMASPVAELERRGRTSINPQGLVRRGGAHYPAACLTETGSFSIRSSSAFIHRPMCGW